MTESFFEGQLDNERVVAIWRRNPATLLREAVVIVAATLVVVSSFLILGASFVTSLLIALWLITIPFYAGLAWYRWWNDLYVLTNQRLVDVDQRGLFHRVVTELPLENVQDATFEIRGVVQTFLNFGSVLVMTASGTTEIDIVGVTDPQAVQQKILRTVKKVNEGEREPSPKMAKSKSKTQLG